MTEAGGLLLVGCGKMGGALLGGWLTGGMATDAVAVVEPHGASVAALDLVPAPLVVATLDDLPESFVPRTVVFAVKPQALDSVVPPYRRLARPGTVFLSIAAGKPIAFFEARLGAGAAVVRAMPNTPAAIGRGITAAIANAAASPDDRAICDRLLGAVGAVAWLDDEAQMDAVTAVSGSGPAYVFHMVEALAAAGEAAGLPADLSMRLARTTVAGSGELLHRAAEDAATLRRNVTSPGGTTEAALAVLMAEGGLTALMTEAVRAAQRRSVALSGPGD